MTTTTGWDLVEQRLAQLLELDPGSTDPVTFRGRQFDLGLAWVHFPEGSGGLGLPVALQEGVDQRLRALGADDGIRNGVGLFMAAPTIVVHGTPAQRERFLRTLFTCEELWCQLFSEPGAGSDLAGVATRATRDGDGWVVRGQKVWTSMAHQADWGILLARSDPDQPKHRGLTYFLLDMHAPGVEVRPLRQMTGEAEFNEVFLTDVVVPDEHRLGGIGEGWRVAMTTLMNERAVIGAGPHTDAPRPIDHALAVWRARGGDDPVRRDRMARAAAEAEVLRLLTLRSQGAGADPSLAKQLTADTTQRIYDLAVSLLGADGTGFGSYAMVRPTGWMFDADVRKLFLRSRATTIEGGTAQIMRNILGERVLGLPPEPRVDRDVPWSQTPRA
jgi:alkylation response protein AidB-like acyl-CoA dehydrogenase